ncbi:heparinase II/III family protein [Neobacillus sp. 179-C4.2 HS]|uniref:Heparinase II/III family protein n=1 Tax=Neobacillus driksii TaxID=3035913 RepID=A0ABV4YZ58_9BACI|nr:heparinase II/III family protein [Neobacillus sp. 179.-C4.2 HS]MDP5194602.1 heparinase II/III family protein [Neobacillus sp. 179.-C4.2 HS]
MLFNPSNLSTERLDAILGALPKSRNKDYLLAAKNIVEKNSYTLPPFGVVKFSKLIDWNDNRSRSFERLIHGFTFLGCLTDAYKETQDLKYLTKGMELITDWLEKHSYQMNKGTMAYHDETTALRLQYLLKFYIYARNVITESDREKIETRMWETAGLLSEEHFHATNTNHGMFQDISLLLFGFYFDNGKNTLCKSYINLAVNRLKEYFLGVFTTDGVHKEQSPNYHMMVALNIKKLVSWMEEIDTKISEDFVRLFDKSKEYSTYIIRPDGKFPPMCDTESIPVNASSYGSLYTSDTYKFAVSSGKAGKAPNENMKVFPEAGYAIFRDDWLKKEKATYVLFSAAYNANYHKHSDDLNLTIYSGGEIITEAGPNGYNYQDPFTKYAYSSFAHNTLIVDGKGLPRTDGKFESVYISDHKISEDISEVTGVNKRFQNVEHQRKVKYQRSNNSIYVNDEITSNKKHEYKLLWHVAPDVHVHLRDRMIELFRNNEKIMEIEITANASYTIQTVKGQTVPTVLGWKFPKMEAKEMLTTIEIDLSGKNVSCTTEFRLTDFKIPKREKTPFALEKEFKSFRSVRYHFEPATSEKHNDQLLVIFSALGTRYSYLYNYMSTLKDIPANKLFILDDFGDQGSYYLGKNRDFSIETSVVSLIHYIMRQNKINAENVTTMGSSKGGYTAIYYGIKYYFGNVIAGAPQSKMGSFLLKEAKHPNIANYIAGGTEEADCLYLDDLLYKVVNQPSDVSPNLHIFVGKNDHHYQNHVLPLYNVLKNRGYKVDLKVSEGVNHDELKVYFPYYLLGKTKEVLGIDLDGKTDVLPQQSVLKIIKLPISVEDRKIKVDSVVSGSGLKYAFYIYKDDEVLKKYSYTNESKVEHEVDSSGIYFARVYVRDQFGAQTAMNTTKITIK